MGSRELSVTQGRSIETVGREVVKLTFYLLWVDGVLSEDRKYLLAQEAGFAGATQYDDYLIAKFVKLPARFTNSGSEDRLRYLDPHRFVLATDLKATRLEVNFNPTPEQVKKLRDFLTHLKRISNEPT